MAHQIPGKIVSFEGGSTAINQFRFVAISSTRDNSVVPPSAGVAVAGVMTDDYSSTEVGKACSVQLDGVAKVQATASTLAFGDLVATDANGRAVPVAAGDYAVGRVVSGSSGAVDRILSVLLQPIGTT